MTLTTLDLSKCDLGNEGVKHIISALMDNKSIENINLSHNELDELSAAVLAEFLSRSTSLKHLDLSWNSLYSAAAWKTLISAFQKNKTLLSLILSWNSLGTECLPHLHKLIKDSQTIEKLDLSCKYYTNNMSYRNNCISNIYQS
jgi:Ran GTPase-activating protein (RanGAP) involved in mRNA processing and transport